MDVGMGVGMGMGSGLPCCTKLWTGELEEESGLDLALYWNKEQGVYSFNRSGKCYLTTRKRTQHRKKVYQKAANGGSV
jgi:hypothetical protein